MKNYTFYSEGIMYRHITKRQARIYFERRFTVYICPCKLRPFTPFHPEIRLIGNINDFDKLVNNFEYYNCINSETGKYSAFYIPVGKIHL